MTKRDVKGIAKVTAGGPSVLVRLARWSAIARCLRFAGLLGLVRCGDQGAATAGDRGRFRALVTLYKEGPFQKLAPSTQRIWGHWLDRIASYFGTLSIAQFDRPERIRPIIRNWRNQWSDKPRTADYGMQVLSAVLSHAVDPLGKLTGNACIGIKQLYASNRSDIIWTEADIARVKQACTSRDGARHRPRRRQWTAARQVLRLSWSHVGTDAIVIRTGKSKGKREAIIPLYDDLRDVLARIPKRSTRVLTNSRGRPWLTYALSARCSSAPSKQPIWPMPICTSTICAARPRHGSISPAWMSAPSPRLWVGKKRASATSFASTSTARPRLRLSFGSSTRGRKWTIARQNFCKTFQLELKRFVGRMDLLQRWRSRRSRSTSPGKRRPTTIISRCIRATCERNTPPSLTGSRCSSRQRARPETTWCSAACMRSTCRLF